MMDKLNVNQGQITVELSIEQPYTITPPPNRKTRRRQQKLETKTETSPKRARTRTLRQKKTLLPQKRRPPRIRIHRNRLLLRLTQAHEIRERLEPRRELEVIIIRMTRGRGVRLGLRMRLVLRGGLMMMRGDMHLAVRVRQDGDGAVRVRVRVRLDTAVGG